MEAVDRATPPTTTVEEIANVVPTATRTVQDAAAGASTHNEQGNGNWAYAGVGQSNDVDQMQRSAQFQGLPQACKG